jgi:hypothetical protein
MVRRKIFGIGYSWLPFASSSYYFNGSLTITNGGTDWIQQRHTATPFVLHRILLKWTLTNNSGTEWIQLATPRDIIQLNPVTNNNSGTLLAIVLVCKFWLRILPSTFSLAFRSVVASYGLKWRMGEGGDGRMGGDGGTLQKAARKLLKTHLLKLTTKYIYPYGQFLYDPYRYYPLI